ncbi:RING/U-box superfamily protein [Trifolium repens]|nr:RING/U-box superfamily protein [Trifolium repens]
MSSGASRNTIHLSPTPLSRSMREESKPGLWTIVQVFIKWKPLLSSYISTLSLTYQNESSAIVISLIRCEYHDSLNTNLNELPPDDKNTYSCIICQDEFKYQENIGTIQCRHKFHLDCISKWLKVILPKKNG